MLELIYSGRTAVAGRGVIALPCRGMTFCNVLHIGELVDAAEQKCDGARVVMVHREAMRGWGLPEKLDKKAAGISPPFLADAIAAGYTVDPPTLNWLVKVQGPDGGPWRQVYFLPYDRNDWCGPWHAAASYQELVLALGRFAWTAKLAWAGTVGLTAERLITSTHPRDRGGKLLEPHPVMPPPCEDGALENPWRWRKPFDAIALRDVDLFVHHVDLNSAYLAAWQTVELGHGEPEHHPAGVTFAESIPGVWRIRNDLIAMYRRGGMDCDELPTPLHVETQEWVTTPTLRRLTEWAGPVPVLECWTWPARTRYLRGAAERLRDARADLTEDTGAAASIALSAVKALYRVETGRFNLGSRGDNPASERRKASGWWRPDWGNFVRAQARANLHRRLAGYPTKNNGWTPGLASKPFAIDTDDLLFVSTQPDPAVFAAAIGLPWGTGLGQFKAKATVPLTGDLAEQLGKGGSARSAFDAVKLAAAAVPA